MDFVPILEPGEHGVRLSLHVSLYSRHAECREIRDLRQFSHPDKDRHVIIKRNGVLN
jgi:hypothetical protein